MVAGGALHRLGYVWRTPAQLPPVTWSAVIPSLMTHVLNHAKSSHEKPEAVPS